MIAVGAGFGAYLGSRRLGGPKPWLIAAWAVALLLDPLLGLAGGTVVVATARWQRAAAATQRKRLADSDVALFADLVLLGLGAGLSLRSSVEEASRHVVEDLRVEVSRLIEAMDRHGVGPALGSVGGRLDRFGRVAAAAALSGAPVAMAVGAYAATLRHAEHAAAVERARRLPVRMLLPLALLILPGFVVLAVGPAVLQSLARLGPIP